MCILFHYVVSVNVILKVYSILFRIMASRALKTINTHFYKANSLVGVKN